MSFFGRRGGSPIGSNDPAAIELGRYWDGKRNAAGEKLRYGGGRSVVVVAPNRAGKGSKFIINNLLSNTGVSFLVLDPRGEAAAVTAPFRRKLGPVRFLNPFGMLTDIRGYRNLKSSGSGLLDDLNPASPLFFDHACGKGEALIKTEGDSQVHFPKSARGLCTGLVMGEVIDARREKRRPSLANVRAALTEPDESDPKTGKPVKGLRARALRLVAEGGPQIASLMGRYTASDYSDELRGVISTADTQTTWLLSQPMRDDMAKGGPDFRELGDRVCTYYVILPHEMVETHSVWLRLIVSTALRALYRPRPKGVRCAFILDEFAALGRLREIEMAQGLTAGFGIQLIPILQSLTQLKLHYEDGWENFLAQAGSVVGFAPNDAFSADWMSKRSGELTIRNPSASTNMNAGGGVGSGSGEGYTRRPYLMPQDFYQMQPGHACIWAAGMANPIHSYLPSYWDVGTLARRARRNPYYAR